MLSLDKVKRSLHYFLISQFLSLLFMQRFPLHFPSWNKNYLKKKTCILLEYERDLKGQICNPLPARFSQKQHGQHSLSPFCHIAKKKKSQEKKKLHPPRGRGAGGHTRTYVHSLCLMQHISSPQAVITVDSQAEPSIHHPFKMLPDTFIEFHIDKRDN